MDVVKRLRDRGVGIIYVSHRLPEIFALADRVTVLRDGTYVGTKPIGEVTEGDLVSMMVGRAIDHLFPKVDTTPGETVLELQESLLSQRRARHQPHAARRRDRRHRRPGRRRAHGNGAHHLRHHARDLRRDPDRRQAGHRSRAPTMRGG